MRFKCLESAGENVMNNIQFKTTYKSFTVHSFNAHFSHHSLCILVNLVWLIRLVLQHSLKIWTVISMFFLPRNWFVWQPDGWIRSQGSVQHAVGKLYPILSQPLWEPSGWASGQTPVPSSDQQPETSAPRPESQQIRRYSRCEMMWKAPDERFTTWLLQISE